MKHVHSVDLVPNLLSLPVSKVSEIAQVERRKTHISLDNNLVFFNNESYMAEFLIDDNCQEDNLTKDEENVMLLDAIEMLEPTLKEAIKMSFFQDMNQKQIAEEMGVSQMQVSRRIKKALNQLGAILTKKWS